MSQTGELHEETMAARLGPIQRMLELRVEEVDLYRDMSCPFYERCLVLAAQRQWHSFTCRKCERFIRLRGEDAIIAITPKPVEGIELSMLDSAMES